MAKKITRQSKITFGKHKGRKISTCDTGYLRWIVAKLTDSDLYAWAAAAEAELAVRAKEGRLDEQHKTLEQQADDLLRKAGFKP